MDSKAGSVMKGAKGVVENNSESTGNLIAEIVY